MSEIDAVLYEYVKSIHVIYTDLFCFQASTALCIFVSTHANSWIKVAARQNTIWIRFGNRRAVRRWRAEAGMALAAIGEFTQWGGVADCSGSRTVPYSYWCSVKGSIDAMCRVLYSDWSNTVVFQSDVCKTPANYSKQLFSMYKIYL